MGPRENFLGTSIDIGIDDVTGMNHCFEIPKWNLWKAYFATRIRKVFFNDIQTFLRAFL